MLVLYTELRTGQKLVSVGASRRPACLQRHLTFSTKKMDRMRDFKSNQIYLLIGDILQNFN